MGTTPTHTLRYPDATAVAKPRIDITNLAIDVDTKMPRITYGTGAAPTSGARAGDVHLQYTPAALAAEENVPLPDGVLPADEE